MYGIDMKVSAGEWGMLLGMRKILFHILKQWIGNWQGVDSMTDTWQERKRERWAEQSQTIEICKCV